MRPDAVPFGLLRHSSRLFGVFLKPLRVLFELLGSLLGASWSLLERSWAVLERNCVVLGRLFGHLICFRTLLVRQVGGVAFFLDFEILRFLDF